MANPQMAILHDIDKCVRCRGCVVACKRRSSMTPKTTAQFNDPTIVDSPNSPTLSEDRLMVIKSQQDIDMGPMVRYSCWHCYTPSCITACPLSSFSSPTTSAIRKLGPESAANGAVIIQPANCTPDTAPCARQCIDGCRGGGFPKIQNPPGAGDNSHAKTGYTDIYPNKKLHNKCDMCFDRVEAGKIPLCVQTCPADAMKFDSLQNIVEYINANMANPDVSKRYKSTTLGQRGNVIWVSRNGYFQIPKADPYVEDHMSQAVDKLMRGPFARLAMVPAGLALGFYALQKRKETVDEEACVG